MHSRLRAHFRSNLVGYLGVFLALTVGTAYAAEKLGGKDIKRNAIKTKHVKDGTLLASDFAPGQLPAGSQGPAGQPGATGQPGAPGQDATAPAGTVAFFNLASCPAGWTEFTAAQGRYVVGVPAGGTLGAATGTALTSGENRAVGQHTHTITDPGHSHTVNHEWGVTDWDGSAGVSAIVFDSADRQSPTPTPAAIAVGSSSNTTGITVNNAGSVAGTSAPYIQLRVCEKS